MNKLYITIIAIVFIALAIVFNTLPRPTFSELEKRELATFPEFSTEKLASGEFTNAVSSWFSDSEPFRDQFMTLSMQFKRWIALNVGGDEQITFHAADDEVTDDAEEQEKDDRDLEEYNNVLTPDEKVKIGHRGILVIGNGDNVRALMAYGGGPNGGVAYADAANTYQHELGSGVQVYCMVIPTSIEFYCPTEAKSRSKSQRATITNIYAHLDPEVKAVDVYSILGRNAQLPIYLRTDHHWSPLGAYLAACQLAKVAEVPFRDLITGYSVHVVHDFVGTMYGYSKDIAIKNSPEDFFYYTPKNVDYTTTYVNYAIDKNQNVVAEYQPCKGEFFVKFKDGSGGAYCTFMGGDTKLTKVETGTHNGRRLLIIKDSFGNALPGYMFYSFEQVHVVDFRYFRHNMKKYVADNQITDVVIATNIFNSYNPKVASTIVAMLHN